MLFSNKMKWKHLIDKNNILDPFTISFCRVTVCFMIRLYADDTILMSDNTNDLQYNINIFAEYCKWNRLVTNSSKTKIIIFNGTKKDFKHVLSYLVLFYKTLIPTNTLTYYSPKIILFPKPKTHLHKVQPRQCVML